MKYSLNILASPYSGQSSDTAYQFARAALGRGHSIYRIFFFGEGVYNANHLVCSPQDEADKFQRWSGLSTEFDIDLVVCVASALKRGILDQTESTRAGLDQYSTTPPFDISGLGQLYDAIACSDRLVSFGR